MQRNHVLLTWRCNKAKVSILSTMLASLLLLQILASAPALSVIVERKPETNDVLMYICRNAGWKRCGCLNIELWRCFVLSDDWNNQLTGYRVPN